MISDIIMKLKNQGSLNKEEIAELLSANDDDSEIIYEAARETRKRYFGNRIFLYGFVYFSTWCRNDCNFCYYRKSNSIERYRKEPDEIIEIASRLSESGVHLIDLTMGEDLRYHKEAFDSVLNMIRQIKGITGLPVMISPGVVDDAIIDRFAEENVEFYALYQETHNRELFKNLRIGQDYDERMHAKLYAKEKGMYIEEGIMTGIGETVSDLADSILLMSSIGAKQLRVMSFVPQAGIPMEHNGTPERSIELKVISVLRLLNPDVLIPASLDVDGIAGLKDRINAGANVVTSIIPPASGLAGVAQNSMDINEGGRTVKGASAILKEMGLVPATVSDLRKAIGKKSGKQGV